MELILFIIVGGLVGWVAGLLLGGVPGGIIGNIVAGIVGAWIGHSIIGTVGPVIAGIALLPALIGAIIFVAILSLIIKIVK
ncbi:GlsB/YeaQ/YmgE family stress response membrane protein [Halalkalibacillus sediminis]|uniref:GlsB/YeaQ/YmgE family stress response membrane protein n=1 Tax=Halalkalibacillus sediminis TaxID=2018042 RepID=A0A2I0QRQ1_9BACI|nr:GlsB/YeaQ/YmgE family stress response membrane protein [Halalkalibacillus sediminis]PKR77025.1 GlsB/YeaQ/YmgE family stress response membrane protein [Halalkalibacillus sediminis]